MKVVFNCPVGFGIFFLLMLLSFSCRGPAPTADEVITAINRDSIRTQNGISLSPDYRSLYISLPTDETNAGGRSRTRIFECRWTGEAYGPPEAVSFNSKYNEYHPVCSPNGERIYFNSNRPRPGTEEEQPAIDIWYVDREGRGWSEPRYLAVVNTDRHESYPTVDTDGRLFFNSDRKGGRGSMDIWSYDASDERFTRPRWVQHLNSADSENDLTISPDGQLLIFNRYHFADGSIDLFYSRREDGKWSDPVSLEKINEPEIWELTPTIGPNGILFLYEREGLIRAMPLKDVF